MPARDEEESLPETLREIYAAFLAVNVPHEIVVVDDGSKYKTLVRMASVARLPTD
jgi:dolichol-phosphate mannosyltransferase